MPYRITPLVQDQIYHIFNRGVAKQPIFFLVKDHERFLELVDYYRFTNIPCSYSQLKKIVFEDQQKIINNLRIENNINVEISTFRRVPIANSREAQTHTEQFIANPTGKS